MEDMFDFDYQYDHEDFDYDQDQFEDEAPDGVVLFEAEPLSAEYAVELFESH